MALMGDNFNVADGARGSWVAGVGGVPFIALDVTYSKPEVAWAKSNWAFTVMLSQYWEHFLRPN